MESRFGEDFGDVRIHDSEAADRSARTAAAGAYTVGNEIVFRRGLYSPGGREGRRMLAHELSHVVQQRAGPVAGTPVPGGVRISSPDDPFERAAERAAASVLSTGPPTNVDDTEDD